MDFGCKFLRRDLMGVDECLRIGIVAAIMVMEDQRSGREGWVTLIRIFGAI